MEFFAENKPMGEINMTPLVDVMLVLLVIFILAFPVLHQVVALELPQVNSSSHTPEKNSITLSINAQGQFFWETKPVSSLALSAQLQRLAKQTPPPQILMRGDKDTPYRFIAEAMAVASRAGVSNIGFLTLPETETKERVLMPSQNNAKN